MNLRFDLLSDTFIRRRDNDEVGNKAKHHHIQTLFPGYKDFGYCAHTHDVDADAPQESAFRWSLVIGSRYPSIRAFSQGRFIERQLMCCQESEATERRRICIRKGNKTRVVRRSQGSHQRIRPGHTREANVIMDNNNLKIKL
jgi:hypothetical protein